MVGRCRLTPGTPWLSRLTPRLLQDLSGAFSSRRMIVMMSCFRALLSSATCGTTLWEVAPSRPHLAGKAVQVQEKGLRLAFCILAENALPGGAGRALH